MTEYTGSTTADDLNDLDDLDRHLSEECEQFHQMF